MLPTALAVSVDYCTYNYYVFYEHPWSERNIYICFSTKSWFCQRNSSNTVGFNFQANAVDSFVFNSKSNIRVSFYDDLVIILHFSFSHEVIVIVASKVFFVRTGKIYKSTYLRHDIFRSQTAPLVYEHRRGGPQGEPRFLNIRACHSLPSVLPI